MVTTSFTLIICLFVFSFFSEDDLGFFCFFLLVLFIYFVVRSFFFVFTSGTLFSLASDDVHTAAIDEVDGDGDGIPEVLTVAKSFHYSITSLFF